MIYETSNWEKVSERDLAFVAFTASWCVPCQRLKPEFAKASVEAYEQDFFIVDVDKIPSDVLELFSVRSVPQIWIVGAGSPIKQIEGRTSASIIESIKDYR